MKDTKQYDLPIDDADQDARAAYDAVLARTEGNEVAHEPETKATAEPAEQDQDARAETKRDADAKSSGGRDSQGRFTSKAKGRADTADNPDPQRADDKDAKRQDAATDAEAGGARGKSAGEAKGEGVGQVAGGPPPSWSIKAKTAWDSLPADVRADVLKREQEVAQGLSALREYKDLKPYAEMAQRHGTTISRALDHYIGIENTLRQDLGAGFAMIAQNSGLNQQQAAQLFANLAQRYGAGLPQASATQPNGASDPLLDAMRPVLNPLLSELQQLKSQVQARAEADRNAQTRSLASALEQFASNPENRFFPDLEDTMVRLFESGMVRRTGDDLADIKTAYEQAAALHPEVREALIEKRLQDQQAALRKKEQEAAEKAKAASRSIAGSRVPGSVIKDRDEGRGSIDDVEADVRRAYQLVANG